MSTTGNLPVIPLQITFHHAESSSRIEARLRRESEKLGHFYPRIMGCRVAIEGSRGRREGNPWDVRIDLTVPGGELVVKQERSLSGRARRTGEAEIEKHMEARGIQKDLSLAIRDAFKSARRQLQDYARCQRGDVKELKPHPPATVVRLFPEKGFGFLSTQDGREIYFHERSVLNHAFEHLGVGSRVAFEEEMGEKGPQASSVRVLSRRPLPRRRSSSTQ